MTLSGDHQQNISRIQAIFPEKIHSWHYFDDGFDSFAYEINNDWIFKIPRRKEIYQMLKGEKEFLDYFSKISTLPVPEFKFAEEGVMGYKKIHGQKFTAELLDSLSLRQKASAARVLGQFLAKLHSVSFKVSHISEYRSFFTREGLQKLLPKIQDIVLPQVSSSVQAAILDFLSQAQADERNFDHPQGLLHNDLYSGHIYWDEERQEISGIIDFGEISVGPITKDFTLLADFCDPKNDAFLEGILSAYSADYPDLFRKVKLFSKIEKLYWPVEDIEDSKIDPSKLNNFEKNLEKVKMVFG